MYSIQITDINLHNLFVCHYVISALIPARYILAILGSIGMAIIYGLKVNLSVAMVAMLNHTAISHPSGTALSYNTTHPLTETNSHSGGEPECQGSDSTATIEVCL